MDPVDPKRRGRGLFGGRRRHEHAAEAEMNEPTTTAVPDAPVSEGPPELAPSTGRVDLEAPTTTVEAAGEPSPAAETEDERTDDPVVVEDDPTIVPDAEPTVEAAAESSAAAGAESGLEAPKDSEGGIAAGTDPAPATESTPVVQTSTGNATDDAPGEPEPVELPAASAATAVAVDRPGSDGDPTPSPADDVEAESEPEEEDGPEPYDLPRIIAIANQKGGVGKTTTSVNLGASLAELGYRVLVVDLDPQGNATTGLGVNARELGGSIYDVIMNDAPVEDCVEPTSLKNLFVAPATIDLAGAEIELVPAFSRELKLRRALHEIRDDYDYVLIDCPPSLGLLTVNGLAAADDVVVPIQCEYYALEGLSQLIRNVSLVQKNLNPSLAVRGIVLTMYDARTKLADQVEQEVRNHFDRTVYQTVIPRTVRLSEAPSFGQPIILFDPTSRGAVAYRELAKEVSSGATRRTG
jgi:chromosome partitioning protein